MYAGGKLQIVQDDDGIFKLYFVSGDNKCHKIFTMGDAVEALNYLLFDDVGRERKCKSNS